MPTTRIQCERTRVDKAIRAAAWVMLIIGILVVSSGFAIEAEYGKVHWIHQYDSYRDTRCLPKIPIPETYEQYWCGFLVSFTGFILLANYTPWPIIEKRLPKLLKKKSSFWLMVLLSMLSGLAVMSQDGETLGRVRQYDLSSSRCEEYSHTKDEANRFHLRQILRWLYLILFSANALVVLSLVLIIAFLADWILEVIMSSDSMDDLPPPAYTPDHIQSFNNDVQEDRMPLLTNQAQYQRVPLVANEPQYQHSPALADQHDNHHVPVHASHLRQQFHQPMSQQPVLVVREGADSTPLSNTSQLSQCPHCNHSYRPQETLPAAATSSQRDTEEDCEQQQQQWQEHQQAGAK